MTVFEEQLDNLALSDHSPPVPPPQPRRDMPEDVDIDELVLSPMAGETKEDRESGGGDLPQNRSTQQGASPAGQHSPHRPQHLHETSHGQHDEVSRLRAELAAAKSEISSLRVELSQQQYELEEVNLIINLQDELRAVRKKTDIFLVYIFVDVLLLTIVSSAVQTGNPPAKAASGTSDIDPAEAAGVRVGYFATI